jgi:DNA-binding FrmR family transcriptional regulator
VERALVAGDECADILMLLAAVRGGVNGLMAEVLEDHVRLHIMTPEKGTDSPEEVAGGSYQLDSCIPEVAGKPEADRPVAARRQPERSRKT